MSSGQRGDAVPSRVVDLLARAAAQARAEGRRVLVSLTEQIAAVDPLDVLEEFGRRATVQPAIAGHAAAGRIYWARPREGVSIAGLGAAVTMSPAGPDRFADVDQAWATLREGALIADDSRGATGTGPVLMGGGAFDPHGARAPHWSGFPNALFMLPRLQVTTVGGACWLTTNAIVGRDGALDVGPAAHEALRGCISGARARGERSARETAGRRAHASPGGATPSAANGRGAQSAGVPRSAPAMLTFDELRPAREWRALVARAVEAIRDHRMLKVVLARGVHARADRDIDIIAMLRHLRAAYPDCHVFGCWRDDAAFVGASPERLVRLAGREVLASSLAGSAPRGTTPHEDAELATELLASAKDLTEHAIVRESLCAGLGGLCEEISAPAEPSLFTLPHVHHLHTAVRARLRAGRSLLDLVTHLHPTPAVGGAPREAALRFIREQERLDRGWYAAPIGWVGQDGGEFAVALRSAIVRGSDAWLFAGSGIVADSDPEAEYAETLLKLRPMEQAIAAGIEAAQPESGEAGADEALPAAVGDGGAV